MKDKGRIMQKLFGTRQRLCRDCMHLKRNGWNIPKCECYGISNSEATDWKISQTACGLWNVDSPVRDVYKMPLEKKAEPEIEGQIRMEI